MKHTIRQHGQLTQIDCELGSGLIDKNCKEILAGDIVKVDLPALIEARAKGHYFNNEALGALIAFRHYLDDAVIDFWHATFVLKTADKTGHMRPDMWICPLRHFCHDGEFIEVVGHVNQ